MPTVRTRKDVWKLADWDPTLLWYAKAIADMKTRSLGDPTSWRYQAAIHDYIRAQDPNASPSDQLPTSANQQRFWRQCQHNSWFFLSWHRMYLTYFEQIVAAAVVRLGGPADWALPYWNYSDTNNPNARRLPPAFRAATLPDGTPNALRVAARRSIANNGGIVADDEDVDIQVCLTDPSFVADPIGGDPGFGGRKTLFNHSGGAIGTIEGVPHGSMHVAVGGNGGWMSRFNTAGLDPIFWLHHCNIDRLWTVWRLRDPLHLDPNDSQWLTGVAFEFNDAAGNVVSMTSSQVVDTTVSPLFYQYEDVSDPIGGLESVAVSARRPGMADAIPEMIGATETPVTLTGQPASTSLSVGAPTGPAAALEAPESPRKVYLNLENITGSGDPTSYAVYLNVPPGEDPLQHPELRAGILPMFGVAEASQTDQDHPGSGLHYALEVSKVIQGLAQKNAWNPNDVRVTFVPKGRDDEGLESVAVASPIQVGRVSMYSK